MNHFSLTFLTFMFFFYFLFLLILSNSNQSLPLSLFFFFPFPISNQTLEYQEILAQIKHQNINKRTNIYSVFCIINWNPQTLFIREKKKPQDLVIKYNNIWPWNKVFKRPYRPHNWPLCDHYRDLIFVFLWLTI